METDIRFRFKQSAWGYGYATEAAFACLQYGFKSLEIQRITARAMPENIASIRVLEKCGMRYGGKDFVDGHTANIYELLNPVVS